VPSEHAEVEELRDWKVDRGDIRADSGIAREILEFIEQQQVRSGAMTEGIIGCPRTKLAGGSRRPGRRPEVYDSSVEAVTAVEGS
jgi:hypothetical protein